nr:hypothetical protein [Leptospira interrogans]
MKLSKTLSYGSRLKLSKTLSYGSRLNSVKRFPELKSCSLMGRKIGRA